MNLLIPNADAQFPTSGCLGETFGRHVGSSRSPLAQIVSRGSMAAWANVPQEGGDGKISKIGSLNLFSGVQFFIHKFEISASGGGDWYRDSTCLLQEAQGSPRLNVVARIILPLP